MRKGVPIRRIVALIAAYVVAAQALLLPLSLAAGAAAPGVTCATSAGEAPSPSHGNTGCPCAAGCGMACCAQALSRPSPVSVAIVRTFVRSAMPVPARASPVRPAENGPQSARAPPVA
jgi:hypothetical protein